MEEENIESSGEVSEVAAPLVNEVEESHVSEAVESHEEKTVPLVALQSERDKRQKLEEDLRYVKEHLALLSANKTNSVPEDDFEKLSDDDVLTVRDFKKLSGNLAISLEELKIAQKYPDYNEVISTYLPEVIKQSPKIRDTLQKTQDFELAYYLAKNSEGYREKNSNAKKSLEAKKIIENSNKAGSLSSMGSVSPISQAKRYKEMSDEEFLREVNSNSY
jgi:hypothetical protein